MAVGPATGWHNFHVVSGIYDSLKYEFADGRYIVSDQFDLDYKSREKLEAGRFDFFKS